MLQQKQKREKWNQFKTRTSTERLQIDNENQRIRRANNIPHRNQKRGKYINYYIFQQKQQLQKWNNISKINNQYLLHKIPLK